MVRGVDTTFLVEVEIAETARHAAAFELLESMLKAGDQIALAPQVLAEFIHVVTDARRFARPLEMADALARAQRWWHARETRQVVPGSDAMSLFSDWMEKFALGRKRLRDTQLAATYSAAGVTEVITTNVRDFSTFGCFKIIAP
jgi:predicted nucleic acid-binding protein